MPASSPAAKARFKAYAKAWAADRYASLKERGICTDCGRLPAGDETFHCDACGEIRKARKNSRKVEHQNK